MARAKWSTEAKAYLAHVAQINGVEYAVIHHDYGLVGAVGLRCLEDMAHVHFWIGVDYQGRGFGKHAMQLLIRSLKKTHLLRDVFTTVNRDNLRSRRVLHACGFHVLTHETRGEGQDYLFMHLALQATDMCTSQREIERRLSRMCEEIGEPLSEIESYTNQRSE